MAFALVASAFTCAQAQDIKAQLDASAERVAKLQALVDDAPKSCGSDNIDGFGVAVKDAALFAIANRAQLDSLYKRQIGETVDGVADVTVKKPSLEEWIALGTTIAGEGAMVKTASDKAQAATTELQDLVKSKSPKTIKVVKNAKAVMTFCSSATPILAEESAGQVKAVQQIIETIKSGKNL